MIKLQDRIIGLLRIEAGLTDREITNRLNGVNSAQQPINQVCRHLEKGGLIARRKRHDGLIGNFLITGQINEKQSTKEQMSQEDGFLSEDTIKARLEDWLTDQGWLVEVSWGHTQGADIIARKSNQCWIIEVKGQGSLQPMRVNYFLGVLGEILQRMNDAEASYSIALPDLPQFRNLWNRLPGLAKTRTTLTAIFVDQNGVVSIEN